MHHEKEESSEREKELGRTSLLRLGTTLSTTHVTFLAQASSPLSIPPLGGLTSYQEGRRGGRREGIGGGLGNRIKNRQLWKTKEEITELSFLASANPTPSLAERGEDGCSFLGKRKDEGEGGRRRRRT